jgi:spermidine synthase
VRLERSDIPPFLIGIASIPAQAILLRELLARGAGNELSLTVDLGLWLGGSALGARLWTWARRRGDPPFAPLLLLGHLIVIGALAAGRFAPLPGVVPGEAPGPLAILALGALVLFLSAFFTAGLFPLAAASSRDAGRAYVAEAVGALIGGSGTTLLLVARVDALTILALAGIVVVSGVLRTKVRWIPAGLLLLGIVSGGTSRLDDALFTRAWEARHPGLELLRHAATPTRVLTLSEREGEQWLMADGSPREVINDPYRDHRIAALLLAAAPRVESVLLIDFGAASVAPVLADAGVERVACLLAEPEDTLLVPPAPGVACVIGDPRRSLRNVQGSWDVIAIKGGEAVTVGSNRLWTAEAFESMSKRLGQRGVVVAIAPGGQASAGAEAQAWRASVASAMKEALGLVRAIDADDFILTSSASGGDATLDPDTLALRYERSGGSLPTYPSERFAVEFPRSRHRDMNPAPANRDLRPAAFAHALARWARRAGLPARPPVFLPILAGVVGLLLFIMPLLIGRSRSRDGTVVLVATGAASMGLDLLVLMTYQARVGILQGGMGFLLGAFLGGTAIGAAAALRVTHESGRTFLSRICLVQAVLAVGAAFLLPRLPIAPTLGATALYGLVACALGVTCGLPFPTIARVSSAGHAWAADAVGGIFGAFLVLTFVGWGVPVTGLVLAVLPLLAMTRFLGSRGHI